MNKPMIIIAAEDVALRQRLQALLCDSGYDVVAILDASGALQAMHERQTDLIILGASREEFSDGLQVAKEIRRWDRWLPLILITATSSEELAIAALKAGINDYFKPPFVFDELLASVKRCLADALPQQAAARRTPRVSHLVNGQQMVGESPPMQEIKAYLRKVAATDSTVMITGESGTGKELAADLVHRNSARHQRPFVCINCAALPDSLIESELFGYEKGAFTGANARKEGQLKLADGGTVFLDEIGDMSPYAQAKILRALESREIQRLGARRSIPLNVRVIAATNHDLERVVEEDKFRKDLYFRLNVARIHLPPLRDRKEDLPLLLNHYVRELNFRFGLAVEGFTAEAFSCLLRYDWPGNIRELKNLLEVSFMNHPCRKIALLDLPEPFRRHFRDAAGLSQDERERMLSALFATHWNMSKAAQKLHWSRMTLYRKMTKYQIVRGGEVGQAVSQLTLSHLPGDVTEV